MGTMNNPPERQDKSAFFKVVCCVLAGIVWFIAGTAVYHGYIVMGKHNPRPIYAAQQPGLFWADVGFFIIMGAWILFMGFRKRKK
jgi:hypothetical protein